MKDMYLYEGDIVDERDVWYILYVVRVLKHSISCVLKFRVFLKHSF